MCDIANMDQTPLPFILDDGKRTLIQMIKMLFVKLGHLGWINGSAHFR